MLKLLKRIVETIKRILGIGLDNLNATLDDKEKVERKLENLVKEARRKKEEFENCDNTRRILGARKVLESSLNDKRKEMRDKNYEERARKLKLSGDETGAKELLVKLTLLEKEIETTKQSISQAIENEKSARDNISKMEIEVATYESRLNTLRTKNSVAMSKQQLYDMLRDINTNSSEVGEIERLIEDRERVANGAEQMYSSTRSDNYDIMNDSVNDRFNNL